MRTPDPRRMVRHISYAQEHNWQDDKEIRIDRPELVDYAMIFIEASYRGCLTKSMHLSDAELCSQARERIVASTSLLLLAEWGCGGRRHAGFFLRTPCGCLRACANLLTLVAGMPAENACEMSALGVSIPPARRRIPGSCRTSCCRRARSRLRCGDSRLA